MLTSNDLREQASLLARTATELGTFFKSDPELPPVEMGTAIVELHKARRRLQKLLKALRDASKTPIDAAVPVNGEASP